MYRTFEELPVWVKAHTISVKVFQMTRDLPRREDYALTAQICRSSNSVTANIAEGFGRKTKSDKSNFYTFARGSAFETQSHLLYGRAIGYFSEALVLRLINDYELVIKELNSIMKSLSDRPQPHPQPQPQPQPQP